MKSFMKPLISTFIVCSALLAPAAANAWWGNNDDHYYDRPWGYGPWYSGGPYGYGGPYGGWGGPYGWGGYPGYGGYGSGYNNPNIILLDPASTSRGTVVYPQ
jgi:hypothetical protein